MKKEERRQKTERKERRGGGETGGKKGVNISEWILQRRVDEPAFRKLDTSIKLGPNLTRRRANCTFVERLNR